MIDVATPVYEGPFDLLLQLILKEQVDIYEVSLSRIVDAYLLELDKMQQDETLDLDTITGFLLIAATLVDLKARRLLPNQADMDLDEELALWEERDLLDDVEVYALWAPGCQHELMVLGRVGRREDDLLSVRPEGSAVGDAAAATADKGRIVIARTVEAFIEVLDDVGKFALSRLRERPD